MLFFGGFLVVVVVEYIPCTLPPCFGMHGLAPTSGCSLHLLLTQSSIRFIKAPILGSVVQGRAQSLGFRGFGGFASFDAWALGFEARGFGDP